MDVSTRQQMWKDMFGNVIEKGAELAGTYDMPSSRPVPKRLKDKKTVTPKTAGVHPDVVIEDEMDILKAAFEGSAEPDDNEDEPVEGEQPKSLPQSDALKPKVDVSGQEPPTLLQKKEAQYYALPSQQRYPMDGYDQVKQASAYFDEWLHEMPPSMRREYAKNLVKRASALGIPVSKTAAHYGGAKAGHTQIKVAFDARRTALHSAMDPLHELAGGNVDVEVLDKLASASNLMDAEALAACLTEFDRATGLDAHWGGDIPDPYYSAFAKHAEGIKGLGPLEDDVPADESIVVGNEYITKREMVEFSKHNQDFVKERYGEEFAEAFAKDPVGIFESLPRDQKLVMMRMANSSDSNTFGASTS